MKNFCKSLGLSDKCAGLLRHNALDDKMKPRVKTITTSLKNQLKLKHTPTKAYTRYKLIELIEWLGSSVKATKIIYIVLRV